LDEPSAGGDNDLDGDDEEDVGNDEDRAVSMEEGGEEPEGGDGNNLDEEGNAEMNENEEVDQEVGDDAGDDDGLYPTDDVVEMEGDETEPHDDEPSGNDETSHSSTQVGAVTDISNTLGSGNMDVTSDALPPPPPDSSSSSSSSALVASSIDIPPIAPLIVPGPILLPCLRGKLMSDGTLNICRGVWAMNDAAHENPDQCRYIFVPSSIPSYILFALSM